MKLGTLSSKNLNVPNSLPLNFNLTNQLNCTHFEKEPICTLENQTFETLINLVLTFR